MYNPVYIINDNYMVSLSLNLSQQFYPKLNHIKLHLQAFLVSNFSLPELGTVRQSNKWIYIIIYRPPKNDKSSLQIYFTEIEKLFIRVTQKFKKTQIFLAGDFKINTLECTLFKTKLSYILLSHLILS